MRKRDTALSKRMTRKYKTMQLPCHICGLPINYNAPSHLDDDALVIDHVIPFALGGDDAPANMKPAHRQRRCNRTKGIRTDGAGIIRRSASLNIP